MSKNRQKDNESIPPHDLDAESAVIGCVLLKPETLPLIRLIMKTPHFFYDRSNGMVFRCLCKLADRGDPVDTVMLGTELKRLNYLEKIGGVMAINKYLDVGAMPHNVQDYAEVVRKLYTYREMIKTAQNIQSLTMQNPEDPTDHYRKAKELLNAACGSAAEWEEGYSAADGANLVWAHIDRSVDSKEPSVYLPIGFHGIEIPRAVVTTVGGRTSNGKTAFCLNIELNLAKTGYNCLHMGMEDNAERYFIRMMANLGEVRNTSISKASVDSEERQRLLDAANEMQKLNVHMCAKKGITTEFIRQYASAYQSRKGLDLLVVDYIQLIRGYRGQSMKDKVSEAMQDLVILAEELNIAIIVVSQVSRPEKGKGIFPPTMHDLKESGDIENHSKMIMLIHRPHVYDEAISATDLDVILAKVSEAAGSTHKMYGYMPHMLVLETNPNPKGVFYGTQKNTESY